MLCNEDGAAGLQQLFDAPIFSQRKEDTMEETRMERPKKVTLAVTLLYASLAIGLLRSALEARILFHMAAPAFIISVTLASFAVAVFFIVMIAQGRNWARITFLVLFIAGLPLSIHALIATGFVMMQ